MVVIEDSERARLNVNVSTLTASNAQNLLTFRANDNCSFGSAAATKGADRGSANNVLTERNEDLDFFRRCEVCNRHGIYENPNYASRAHETSVTFDDEAARVLCLR